MYYDIDKKKLSNTYKKYQQSLHPDKLKGQNIVIGNEEDLNMIMEINKRYKVLENDLLRGYYMVTLKALKIGSDWRYGDMQGWGDWRGFFGRNVRS